MSFPAIKPFMWASLKAILFRSLILCLLGFQTTRNEHNPIITNREGTLHNMMSVHLKIGRIFEGIVLQFYWHTEHTPRVVYYNLLQSNLTKFES